MERLCVICEARYYSRGRCDNWPLCPRRHMYPRDGAVAIAWGRQVWARCRAVCLMDRPRRLPLSWRRLRARLLVRVFFLRLFFRVRARRRRLKTSPDSLSGRRPECSALGMPIPRPAISTEDALERIERLRQELAWLSRSTRLSMLHRPHQTSA